MATATFTWTFDTNAQGLADAGNSANIAFAWDGTDGSPSAGMVKFTCTVNNLTGEVEYGLNPSTGNTWETIFGIASGSTVTAAQITGIKRKRTTDINTTAQVDWEIVNSSNATVHSAGTLFTDTPASGTNDVAWSSTSGASRAVDSSYQASNTDIRLRGKSTLTTGASGTNAALKYDSIAVTITYTAATPPEQIVAEFYPRQYQTKWFPRLWAQQQVPFIPYAAVQVPEFVPIFTAAAIPARRFEQSVVAAPPFITGMQTPISGAVGKLLFSNAPDLRGSAWRTETVVAENTDSDSGAGCYVGNSYVALYSVSGAVRVRRGGNPLDWSFATDKAAAGVAGQVWDVAVNDAGILCALIGSHWFTSNDLGTTWTDGGAGSWGTPAAITSVAHMFIVHSPSGSTMTHFVSVDGGKTFK